jgi:hypothetical protein
MASTVAEIAAQTLVMIEEKVGPGRIADPVKLQVLMEIVEELLEIADSAALLPDDEAQQEAIATEAVTSAIGMYGAHSGASGNADPEQIESQLGQMAGQGGEAGAIASDGLGMLRQAAHGMRGGV